MTVPAATADADADRQSRRNAWVLMAAGAFNGAAPAIVISMGGLAGAYLLGPDKSLATLPVTGFNLGLALGAIPAALLMRRLGRRLGLMSGTLFAMLGGLVAAAAILYGSFAAFALGCLAVGIAGSFSNQSRFAALEGASPAFRPKAISRVMIGGVLAAVIGPQTVILTRDLLEPIPFAGAFLGVVVLAIAGVLILSAFVDIAPVYDRRTAGSGGRPFREIARQPRFLVALLCAMASFGLMSLVMTAAPLAMIACGISEANAVLGIQWHILAMFAPSFVTGTLIARFGKERIVTTGLFLLAACAGVGLAGIELGHFWALLILLGIGWNFGFVGATAMLSDCYRPEERAKVEGINDLLVFGTVALASLSSGTLLNAAGWNAVNLTVLPVIVLALAALGWLALQGRRTAI